MKICSYCGAQIPDDSRFCIECGKRLQDPDPGPDFMSEILSQSEPDPAAQAESGKGSSSAPQQGGGIDADAVKDTIHDVAEKTFQSARAFAGQINDTVEKQKEKVSQEAQRQIDMAQTRQKKKAAVPAGSQDHLSTHELWSWLKKDSRRQHFFTEQPSTVTMEEYIGLLQQKIQENRVPAILEYYNVQWDCVDVSRRYCIASPLCEAVNPLTCLIQFEHVGCFTFVEEKTFVNPPDLPEVPMQPVKIPAELMTRAGWILWGLILLLIGVFLLSTRSVKIGMAVLIAAAAVCWMSFGAVQQRRKLLEHNQKCMEQEKAWNAAWDNWQQNIFLHSFQEDINGEIGRIFDSVFDCIQQLNNELFKGQALTRQEEQSMNELEQLIARRKDEYR